MASEDDEGPTPTLSPAELLWLLEVPGALERWLASHGPDAAPVLREHFARAHQAIEVLLNPRQPTTGAIRIESWNDWPQEQRTAFEALWDFAGMAPDLKIPNGAQGPRCLCPSSDREGSRCTHEPGRCVNLVEAVALEGLCLECQRRARGPGNRPAAAA